MSTSFNIRQLAILTVMWGTAFVAHAMSPADCAAEADRASRNHTSVVGGAARGAAGGAVLGAVVGGNRRGAGRGAAVGAVVGGAVQANRKHNTYQSVYDECMRRQ